MATNVIDSWSDVGLNVNLNATAVKTKCPSCSHTRRNKSEKCLSVNPQKGVANCHNCGDTFVIRSERQETYQAKEYKLPEVIQLPVSSRTIDFFKSRGIEERVIQKFKITESVEWLHGKKADPDKGTPDLKDGNYSCMNFNYYDDGQLVNVKFRGSAKRFKMSPGAKLIFYNLDAIKNTTECSIQEGEIDTMTAYQCNIFSCVSVPNGASKGNQRLEYLDNCIEHFEDKTKIIIATDGDEAGLMLRDELIRRLGRERCWIVDYPEGTKDTNEVLLAYGADAVRKMYAEARQLPIEGIVSGEELTDEIIDIYENGYPKGLKIGYTDFDKLFSWLPGQLTMLTGIPGHGKSEFMDQVMVRLSARFGWRHAVFAPENEPKYQSAALISKFVGGEMIGKGKINEMKRDKGIQFIKDHFFFMKVDEIDVTIDGILDLARELVAKKGINLLLIDPYNYIETKIAPGQSETLYVSELLTKLVKFSKVYQVHIVLVAHPTKIMRDKKTDKYVVPRLYDIAGSANFFNKTYNGICVYRDYEEKVTTVHVQKYKYKWGGGVGSSDFTYEFSTGRYAELGTPYENELERMLSSDSQVDIQFEPTVPIREPGVLTDFNKLAPTAEFDYKPVDNAPF